MAKVKLPSGKIVKVPDEMSKNQTIEFLFEKLEGKEGFEEDRKKLGDQLDTSGWGSTIGGGIGALAGGIGGIFTSPTLVANPITLGLAGGATGAAIGEGVEQWLTGGKGDAWDIGKSALYGGATGAAGGAAAGAIAKGGIWGAGLLGAGGGAIEGGRTGGVGGAATGAVLGGATGGILSKATGPIISIASQKLGLDKPAKSALQIGKDFASGKANAALLGATGRATAGNLIGSAATWEARRNIANLIFKKSIEALKKSKGKKRVSPAETADLRRASKIEADDIWEQQLRGKYTDHLEPPNIKPRGKATRYKGMDVIEDAQGNMYNPSTGAFVDQFNQGGIIGNRRRQDESGAYRDRVTGSETLSTAADFTPIIGDAKAAKEVWDEMQKPEPNWALVGALGGAALIGLIPGIGDAAAAAIKAGAKKGLSTTKRVEANPIDQIDPIWEDISNWKFKPTPTKLAPNDLAEVEGVFDNIARNNWDALPASEKGWNYKGLPADEFRDQQLGLRSKQDQSKFLTDTQREAVEADGILGLDRLNSYEGIASRKEIEIADQIVDSLNKQSNMSPSMIIDDILSNVDQSGLNLKGIATVISDQTGKPFKQVMADLLTSIDSFE